MLLERDDALAAVRGAFREVRDGGRGRFVIVGGEAGVGKSSLLRRLAGEFVDTADVVWGSCDSLSTPRVLGPLSDIAVQAGGGELAELFASGAARDALFGAALRLLSAGRRPTVALIEDVHWADEATIDLLIFLRRRIEATGALVVLSYRDDDLTSQPLQFLLGGARAEGELRLHLRPLSSDAVAGLVVGHDVDADLVYRITGGNPFFVTELLAAGGSTAPPTVRDAVLARVRRLPAEARAVLDAIAMVPSRVEMWLLDGLVDESSAVAAVDDCVASGVLRRDGDGVAFRHELARLAVRDAVLPVRRRDLHRRALAALADPVTGTIDRARLAHHAGEAGDADAVLTHAPLAAEEAARVGAHRQAAEHLEQAVRYAGRLGLGEQVALWRRLGIERTTLGHLDEALVAFDNAIALCHTSGDVVAKGELLSRASTVHVAAGHQDESTRLVAASLDVLEPLGVTAELAYATSTRCSQHMLAREFSDAERWGVRAIEMSQQLGRRDLLCHALIQSGVALLMSGDDAGHARILRGIDIAREEGMDGTVALGYSQIGSGSGEVRRYDVAVPALETGLAHCIERELTGQAHYTRSWLARCALEQGRWREAGDHCTELLRDSRLVGIARTVTVTVLGRLRARRGDPGAWAALDESLALAQRTGHLQRLWPTAVARAEAAWLAGHLDSEVALLEETYRLATTVAYPWAVGELGAWLARAGHRPGAVEPAAEPFRLALSGQLEAAAAEWRSLGCEFEAAVALVGSDDATLVQSALATFDSLGSAPGARLAANRLRELGARVPRGPNAATRRTPGRLTAREIEVVVLLADGLRNAEIAERLVISAKTVDHHVSSVLTKLGVSSRHAAGVHARRLGLLPDVGGAPAKDGEVPR